MEVFREFRFEAAHYLPHVPEDHKCRRLHGHSYRVVVHVRGPLDPRVGWVTDFADIREVVAPLIERMDHRVLNEIEGLENPTCEQVAAWLWRRLRPHLPGLCRVVVHETEHSGCVYEGD